MVDQYVWIMKFEYVTITKTTCVLKFNKFFLVCLTTRQTLKIFRWRRQYLSLEAERQTLSGRGLVALILMAGVISLWDGLLSKKDSKSIPEGVRLGGSSLYFEREAEINGIYKPSRSK